MKGAQSRESMFRLGTLPQYLDKLAISCSTLNKARKSHLTSAPIASKW
jgi:hypothetical protein